MTDSQILKNNLLFNHTYLKELTADTTIDPQIPFSPKDLSDWYSFLDTSSTGAMVDAWVRPMLSLLELEIHPLGSIDEHAFILTTAYDHATAIGVCYVAPPGADLDTTTKGRFWMAQAVLTARRHEPALRWVILTNGDLWRVLDAQALRRYEAYIQIDVGQLARGASDPSALRVFFRCFHRSAFETVDDKTGLEKLLEASDHATEKAEKHLNERVSGTDGIMAQLCLGLVRSTGKSKFSEEERDAIFRDATTLLYRMLFLLYAESRDLLPIDNPKYAAVSMTGLVEMARIGQQRGLDHPQDINIWERLKRLSNAIYESDPGLAIPAYNGGLFDDDDHPYLRDGTIADQYLSRAVYDLAFLPNGNDIQAIDFRDLSVRHLGSLYEGMIEYKLFVAEEPMLARRDKGGIIHFMTQDEAGGLRRNDQEIKTGEVYFAQSSGERRATGTYYTPEYIVDYIVCNTVVRCLEERRASLEEKVKEWLDEIRVADSDERPGLQRTVDEELLKFVEEQVLSFTICDPAMGSGHFLVNASHNMTDFIIETINLTIWDNKNLKIEPEYWRRRVVERCLYGVDISEMAVELAKLSIWLASMAQGLPLSFLRHHIKRGNSLIGVDIQTLLTFLNDITPSRPTKKEIKAIQNGQLSMLDYPIFRRHFDQATRLLRNISVRISSTLADVKAQEADYEQVLIELQPFVLWGNMLLARHFDQEIYDHDLESRIQESVERVLDNRRLNNEDFQGIMAVARAKLFFHWELEFPDVFFDSYQIGSKKNGFSAVVGNPPYIDSHTMVRNTPDEREFIAENYSVASGTWDLYIPFWEKALLLLADGGIAALITPNKWISIEYGKALREYSSNKIFQISDFSRMRVFDNVGIFPVITFMNNEPINGNLLIKIYSPGYVLRHEQTISWEKLLELNNWGVLFTDNSTIVLKMLAETQELSTVCDVEEAFTVSEAYLLKPLVQDLRENGNKYFKLIITGTIDRYATLWGHDTTKYLGNKYRYPSIEQASFKLEFPKRYKQAISKKIVISGMRHFEAFYDSEGECVAAISTVIVRNFKASVNAETVMSILNSKLMTFYIKEVFGSLAMDGGINFTAPLVKTLPIPVLDLFPTKDQPRPDLDIAKIRDSYTSSNIDLYQNLALPAELSLTDIRGILTDLASYMIELYAELLRETKNFLDWLENNIGVQIDELSGKSKITHYIGGYRESNWYLGLEDLLDILKKNKRLLSIDPNEYGFHRALEKRYRESLDVLLPTKKRLTMIDQLIDLAVYRLYGLTEEEIRIVKGEA